MKKKLRQERIAARESLSQTSVEEKSLALLEHFKTFAKEIAGKQVFIFIDFRKEVMTEPLIRYLETLGCSLYIPRIDLASHTMEIHPYPGHDRLVPSRYGIPEPPENPDALVPPSVLEVVITPGVAFDDRGYRIGYGGGYYDRLFSEISPRVLKIALGFELQRIERVPNDPFDRPVDHLVTEAGVYSF